MIPLRRVFYGLIMRYFSTEEMQCGCGCGLGISHINPDTYTKYYRAREIAGVPFIVTSSVRCEKHNRAVGGSETSSHLAKPFSFALDTAVSCATQRHIILSALLEAGFNRIGLGKNFIHVDDDPTKPPNCIWMY